MRLQPHAQSIVEEMKASIHRDINIMDTDGVIVASTNPARCGQVHQDALELLRSRQPSRTVWQDDPSRGVQAGINLPISLHGQPVGVIGITGAPEEVSVLGDVIKRMTELMLEGVQQREASDLIDRSKGLFLENWLFSQPADWAELETRGRLLGMDITAPYTVALLQITPKSPAYGPEEMQNTLILRTIRSHLQEDPQNYCSLLRNHILILLHRSTPEQSTQLLRRLCQTIESYHAVHVSGGISTQTAAPADLRRCYLEAQTAGLAAARLTESRVLLYNEISLDFLVQSVPKQLLKDLHELVFSGCREGEKAEFLSTITQYFAHDGDIRRCADAVFIHRNTFQYRMDSLRKKTGYDLRSPKDATLLYFAACYGAGTAPI